MSMKFNFDSEEEMIAYLQNNIEVVYDVGYYGDAEAQVTLGDNVLATKFIPSGGPSGCCCCSDNNE